MNLLTDVLSYLMRSIQCHRTKPANLKVTFAESDFPSKVEWEAYLRGEFELPCGESELIVDTGVATAMPKPKEVDPPPPSIDVTPAVQGFPLVHLLQQAIDPFLVRTTPAHCPCNVDIKACDTVQPLHVP